MLTVDRAGRAPVNVFNLGTDEYCQVNDSIGWICERAGLSPERHYTGGERGWIGDSPFIFLDTARFDALGWRPKLTIREGDAEDARRTSGRILAARAPLVTPMTASASCCRRGLWHLGCGDRGLPGPRGHDVVGLDVDPRRSLALHAARPPIVEPGSRTRARRPRERAACASRPIRQTPASGARSSGSPSTRRSTTTIAPTSVRRRARPELLPAPAERRAGAGLVAGAGRLRRAQLEQACARGRDRACRCRSPARRRTCAWARRSRCSRKPDRVVVGVARRSATRIGCERCSRRSPIAIEWMSVESAEMTKHALNAFLATSVDVHQRDRPAVRAVGADASEVERGLKSERASGRARTSRRAARSPAARSRATSSSCRAWCGARVAADAAHARRAGEQRRAPATGPQRRRRAAARVARRHDGRGAGA